MENQKLDTKTKVKIRMKIDGCNLKQMSINKSKLI